MSDVFDWGDTPLWETFHENSKLLASVQPAGYLAGEQVERLLVRNLALPGVREISLPGPLPVRSSLGSVLEKRRSHRTFERRKISLQELGDLLGNSVGHARNPDGTASRRGYPSGGALYPVEIFVIARRVANVPADSFSYYSIVDHRLRVLRDIKPTEPISALFAPNSPIDCAAIVLFVALFERTTIKYGERGYRLVLLEAGHLAQNVVLIAAGQGLGSCPCASFFDHDLDERLGLDGIGASCIYAVSIGRSGSDEAAASQTDHGARM